MATHGADPSDTQPIVVPSDRRGIGRELQALRVEVRRVYALQWVTFAALVGLLVARLIDWLG
jgi:hypothetical protein